MANRSWWSLMVPFAAVFFLCGSIMMRMQGVNGQSLFYLFLMICAVASGFELARKPQISESKKYLAVLGIAFLLTLLLLGTL